MARPWLALLLALGLAAPSAAAADPDSERAVERALRDVSHALGTAGYLWGAPLLELAIAEYRQGAGLGSDLAGPRGMFAHADGGRLATHATAWRAAPDPDVLAASAWLDLAAQPYVLFVPPLEGRWYAVRVVDAFGELAGVLTPRSDGSVGGWTLLAHAAWEGARPPRVRGEVRVATPAAWVLVEITATPREAAAIHERLASRLQLLPLAVYQRSPAAAELAQPQPQAGPLIRALPEMRGSLEAFRVINQRLRRVEPAPADAALLALFDRAGFGPRVVFDTARLEAPRLAGLRDAAKDAHRMLRELREARAAARGWQAPRAADAADPLPRAAHELGALPRADLLVLEAHRDADGRRLDGRSEYRIRFAPGALPPADGGWSLAAYASSTERLFGAQGTSLGSATAGLRTEDDGSLEIRLSSDPPDDASNWLPVGHQPFFLVARLRSPAPAALDGAWTPPQVEPLD